MMCLCDAGEAGPEEPSLGSRQLGIRAQHSRVTGSRVEIAPDFIIDFCGTKVAISTAFVVVNRWTDARAFWPSKSLT